ncbi:DUF3310 domain-containing protein [Listeria monocytogenes]|nr:DUF3310 domain-containing protein [Listeria monocytogenes]EJM6842204.1 DUF3310 domain-containing protein [Listeria monocytogenes]
MRMENKDSKAIAENFVKTWANYVKSIHPKNKETDELMKMLKKGNVKQGGIIPNAYTEPPHTKPDNINHPTHYNQGGIETLDYIKAKTPHYESYAIGNIIKYVSRYQHKNGLEDLKKAQFYLNDLVKEMEKNE